MSVESLELAAVPATSAVGSPKQYDMAAGHYPVDRAPALIDDGIDRAPAYFDLAAQDLHDEEDEYYPDIQVPHMPVIVEASVHHKRVDQLGNILMPPGLVADAATAFAFEPGSTRGVPVEGTMTVPNQHRNLHVPIVHSEYAPIKHDRGRPRTQKRAATAPQLQPGEHRRVLAVVAQLARMKSRPPG